MSNRALDGAERKGREARRAGVARADNPYPDWRTIGHGHVTWSRAFRTAWRDGWDAEDRAQTQAAQEDPPCP
jgi:hypothetical protein